MIDGEFPFALRPLRGQGDSLDISVRPPRIPTTQRLPSAVTDTSSSCVGPKPENAGQGKRVDAVR